MTPTKDLVNRLYSLRRQGIPVPQGCQSTQISQLIGTSSQTFSHPFTQPLRFTEWSIWLFLVLLVLGSSRRLWGIWWSRDHVRVLTAPFPHLSKRASQSHKLHAMHAVSRPSIPQRAAYFLPDFLIPCWPAFIGPLPLAFSAISFKPSGGGW